MDSDELNWNGAMSVLRQLIASLLESDPEKRIVDSREICDILAVAQATQSVIEEVHVTHGQKKPSRTGQSRIEP